MAPSLEDLVVEFLERLEQSGAEEEAVLTQLAELHPQQASDLRARVAALRGMGLLASPSGAQTRELPPSLGDFDFVALLGEGGMGVVYRAKQRSMGRQVALKLMRPGFLDRPGARARFAREAQAVARLSHPGIIAVHVSGEEQRIPYLAMDYVPGVSLERVLRAVAGRDPSELSGSDFQRALADGGAAEGEPPKTTVAASSADPADEAHPLFAGAWHEVCLRVARDIARALAHAHERGVLHRDIKPSNIMLTREGRVVLLDFGLASLVGAEAMTHSGAMLGSLPYMAPEQVEGDRMAIDARTDVYGLGATLYQMLTLKSPHLDPESSERTRARILEGRPAAPRSLSTRLPKDAQSVVLVAMDRRPAKRYHSAAAFAHDLELVLERRPILARPAGALAHLGSWAQRHKGAAVAAGLALLIVTLGPSLFALQSSWAKKRLAAQLERADRNYERSIGALELVTGVAVHELSDVPMAETGRRKVLEGAIAFYRDAALEPGSGPEVALDRARAQVRLGDLCEDLGDLDGAQTALESAIAAFQAAGVVSGSARAGDFSSAYRILAGVHERRKQRDAALECIELGLALVPQGTQGSKGSTSEMARLRLKSDRAKLLRRKGERDLAHGDLQAVLDELDLGQNFENADRADLAAWCHSELSELDASKKDMTGSVANLERALEIRQGLCARDPDSPRRRQQWIIALSNLGGAHLQLGDFAAGLSLLERAAQLGESLIEDFPGMLEYRLNLSGVLINMGGVLAQQNDEAGARKCMQRSIEISTRLLESEPKNAEYRTHWMAAATNLVAMDLHDKQYDQALKRLDSADALVHELLAQSPGERTLERSVHVNALNRIRAHWGLAQAAAATRAAAGLLNCDDGMIQCLAAKELGALLEHPPLPPSEREQAVATIFDLLEAARGRGADLTAVLGNERLKSLHELPRWRALVAE